MYMHVCVCVYVYVCLCVYVCVGAFVAKRKLLAAKCQKELALRLLALRYCSCICHTCEYFCRMTFLGAFAAKRKKELARL